MQIIWRAGSHILVFRPRAHFAVGITWPNHLAVLAMISYHVYLSRTLLFVTAEIVSLLYEA